MNNYEYIIACLPVIRQGQLPSGDTDSILEEISSLLEGKDLDTFVFFLSGFKPESLTPEFYLRAKSHRNVFVRDYFEFDLNLRNTKTWYLNTMLGRPEGQDLVIIDEDTVFEPDEKLMSVLRTKDILERERGLDSALWEFIENSNCMKLFCLDVILGFCVELKIVDRWLKLDPETGRILFRKMLEEIRNTREK